MNRKLIKRIILNNVLLREAFFFFGKRKANLTKINKKFSSIKTSDVIVPNLIVSLTSYGDRIKELKYTLYSLLTQTIQPAFISVNISQNDFEQLDEELLGLRKFNVEYYVCENLRSYTKLVPALVKYPEFVIVTADDDIFYESKWLETLWNEHLKYPKDIISQQVYTVRYENNKISSYSFWIHDAKVNDELRTNFLMGVGGVLYPVNSLYKDVTNESLFRKLSPLADDIWFYFMAILQNTKIRQPKKAYRNLRYVNPYREYGIIEGETLGQENVGNSKNDVQFRAVMDYYKITDEKLIKYYECNNEDCILDC